jgi:hypothetical protein
LGEHAQIKTGDDEWEAGLRRSSEVTLRDACGRVLLALPSSEAADDGEARDFGDPGAIELRRIDDGSVDRRGTKNLERENEAGAAGSHQPYATDVVAVRDAAKKTMKRARVEFIGFEAVGTKRLVSQFFAVNGVADAIHGRAQRIVDRRKGFEIPSESFAQIKEPRQVHELLVPRADA